MSQNYKPRSVQADLASIIGLRNGELHCILRSEPVKELPVCKLEFFDCGGSIFSIAEIVTAA